MFADVDIVDESQSVLNIDRQSGEMFTPVCTPTRNRKDLLGDLKIFYNLKSEILSFVDCEEGEWDSEWDEDGEAIKSDNMPMYV